MFGDIHRKRVSKITSMVETLRQTELIILATRPDIIQATQIQFSCITCSKTTLRGIRRVSRAQSSRVSNLLYICTLW